MILVITSSLWLLATIFSVLLFQMLAAYRRRLASVSALSFTIGDMPQKIPDIVMVDSPPIQYRVGKKTLYVQALTIATQDIFLQEYAMFLRQYSAKLEGLRFYELEEVQGIDEKAEMIKKAVELLASHDIRAAFVRVIERVLLKDKLCNPDGIKVNQLLKAITPNQLAQIFYAVYAYNIGTEKKNSQAQLVIIGAASSGEPVTDFSESLKSGDTSPKSGSTSPFQDNPFYPEHLRKSTDGTNDEEKNKKNVENSEA